MPPCTRERLRVSHEETRPGSSVPFSYRKPSPLRCVRPSLLDLRFTGDPWVKVLANGDAFVQLDDYCLVQISVSPLDVPSLYHNVINMRQLQQLLEFRCFCR
jgi:hypothetical protein